MSVVAALIELRITTPRLELRVPSPAEWEQFAAAIAGRVVPPQSEHFVGAWAQLASPDFEEAFVAARRRKLESGDRERWAIELGAFAVDELVGQASVYARDWQASREVVTASFVHPEMRGRGLGTEMRQAILTLAFEVLGARAAWSGATEDNVASNRVSEKLGYELVGHEIKPTAAGEMRFTRLRLSPDIWSPDPAVRVTAAGARLRGALG